MGYLEAEREYLDPDSVSDEILYCDQCERKIIESKEGYYNFKPEVICETCREEYLTGYAQEHYIG